MAPLRRTKIFITLGPSTDAPGIVERLVAAGVEPALTTPANFAAQIVEEHTMWRDVITRAGILVQ